MTMRWAVVLLAVLAGGASGQGRVDRVFQVLRPDANQGLDSDSQKCEALSALEISDLYFAWRGVMSAAAFEEGSRFATPLTPAERTLVVEAAQSNSPELLRASLRTLVLGDAPIADRIGAAQFLAEVSPGQGVDFVLEILAGIEPTHLAGGSVAKALTRVVVGMLQREPQNAVELPAPNDDLEPEVSRFLIRALGEARIPLGFGVLAGWLGSGHDRLILDELASFSRIQERPLRPEILDRLRGSLSSEDWKSRRAAIAILSRQHAVAAIRDLIRCLDDENPRIRRSAEQALAAMTGERLGDDRLLWLEWVDRRERWLIEEWPRVHDELGNDQAERTMEMLRTLSQERLYRDEVSQGMAWLLQDDDQRIRIVAIRTLGHLDGRGMVENLVPLMNDTAEPVRLAAQETLETLAGCDLPDDVDACLRTLRVMGLCQS